jgi:AraC-like DNA-binding protein
MNEISPPDRLRRTLLDRLRPLATEAGRPRKEHGMHPRGAKIFSYCCFTAERLAQFTIAKPVIGIVLSGAKEFWLGDSGRRFVAGDVFVMPGGATLDVVNLPDERTGLYESLIVEVATLPPSVARLPFPARRAARPDFDVGITLTPELVNALAHAATTLATSEHATLLAEHRLAEVLMLLRDDPAARALFDAPLADRVRWIVGAEPSRRWTAEEIGLRLAIGASTLRRRLGIEGTSLRTVLASARMEIAEAMLARGEANVAAAAEAAGYTSRSHFTRRFRSVYGSAPGEHRTRRAS